MQAHDLNRLQIINYRSLNINSAKKLNILNFSEIIFPILKIVPRLFAITTNSNTYHFNIELIKDASLVINKQLQEDSTNLQFHIDINDKKNVMGKFEKIFMGEKVIFDEKELSVSRKITSALQIIRCPNYMKPESLHSRTNYNYNPHNNVNNGVIINVLNLPMFFENTVSKSFTITTNNGKYKCNNICVLSSSVIRDLIEKDPNLDSFFYDFSEEFNEFEEICNFFNFKNVQITPDNMNCLQKIAEDLQIKYVLEKIDKFMQNYENTIKTINEKQSLIDTISELFEWLYNIKELSVEKVKNLILKSIWVQTKENIQELTAFILQVINSDSQYHQHVCDLLILLDKSKDETNYLGLLIPFTVKYLLYSFTKNKMYCLFVYILYKKGIIPIKKITDQILKIAKCLLIQNKRNKTKISTVCDAIIWFFPELYELNYVDKYKLLNSLDKSNLEYLKFYLPDNINGFKRMRDSGEPDDEITKSLRHDDVDTLQSIISKRDIDFSVEKVPFNIYENFVENGNTNYLNYAAAYGSIKCFKYLLLNHAIVDKNTFNYAVFGGNIEIIRISDQYSENFTENDAKVMKKKNNDFNNPICISIKKHQNNLFDWILEQKYSSKRKLGNVLFELLFISVVNGNAYSIIQCIDKGLDLNSLPKDFCFSLINSSCKNGFYRMTQLLFLFINKTIIDSITFSLISEIIESSALFGNISLFKFIVKSFSVGSKNFELAFITSIAREYFHIVKYIIENIGVIFSNLNKEIFLKESIIHNNKEIFDYLIHQFEIIPSQTILITAAQISNFDIVKIIVDLIYENNKQYDFTEAFTQSALSGSEKICRYLIDKKVFLDFYLLEEKVFQLASKNEKIVFMLIEIIDSETKQTFLNSCLSGAIKSGNKKLVEFLLSQNTNIDDALFEAASFGDVEIVDMILRRNNQPFYINQISKKGTALNIAVNSNSFLVVKRLLSLPGIDPSLYSDDSSTPLISAIVNYNTKMIDIILDFYKDEIQSQIWQINDALKLLLINLFSKKAQIKNDHANNYIIREFCDDSEIENDEDINTTNDENENDEGINTTNDENENEIPNEDNNSFDENTGRENKNDHKDNKLLNVIERLLKIKNININCHAKKCTLFSYACETNEIKLVKLLLNYEGLNVNSYLPISGSTPLMIAIKNINLEIAELLIKLPKTNINLRNHKKETVLTIAVDLKLETIVDMFVNDEKFNANESRLDYAFYISTGQITKQLYSVKNLDVNYLSLEYSQDKKIRNSSSEMVCSAQTTLINSIVKNDVEKIDMIISHHSFDPIKSQLKTAIFIASKRNNIEIFQKLIILNNYDVNIFGKNNEPLLHSAVLTQSGDIVSEILNNRLFDESKSDIIGAFITPFTKNIINDTNYENKASISIMNKLCQFDEQHSRLLDFSKLLPNGKSFFTSITAKLVNIDEVVDFLINKGADPNQPDKFGVYPLQHAIQRENYLFVLSLINSQRIDFSIRIGKESKTFLHLATSSKTENILLSILNSNLDYINETDRNGETPLMEAVRNKNERGIIDLFRVENLNYLLKNKKGEDALIIAQKYCCSICIQIVNHPNTNKNLYLTKLLDIIKI